MTSTLNTPLGEGSRGNKTSPFPLGRLLFNISLCSLQLLLGLRDTDDTMVAATLRALSALVPVLGGATVVGGMREKIFTESRPKVF